MPQRILLIEDDSRLAAMLSEYLGGAGYRVSVAAAGGAGMRLLEREPYDALVLDLSLPDMDGLEVCRRLRGKHDLPVLMLTARGDAADRIVGLELGADDYLVKPFSFAELVARVRAVMRRGAGREPDMLQMADLELDLRRCRARRGQNRIDLTKKEFALLMLLMQRRGEVLSRAYIASQIWDINFDSHTNVVDVAMRRLRAKVDDPYELKLIHTLRGTGYVLEEQERHG